MLTSSVIVLAAGQGKRMRSVLPKVLHRAGGRRLIEYVLRTARETVVDGNVVVVLGHEASQISQVVGADLMFDRVVQEDALGTGHAVACARNIVRKTDLCIILYGDSPLLRSATVIEMVRRSESSKASAVLLTAVLENPGSYGRVDVDDQGDVKAIIEPNMATREELDIMEVNSGVCCFRSEDLWRFIGEIQCNNPLGEYYLTDMVAVLRMHGRSVSRIVLADTEEMLGVNTRRDLAHVELVFHRRKMQELFEAGVNVPYADTIVVESDVEVGQDTSIGPFSQILGASRIGSRCVIMGNCVLVDTIVGNGAVVEPFTFLQGVTVPSESVVTSRSCEGIGKGTIV